MQLQKAQRNQVKLRIGLSGSGGGAKYTKPYRNVGLFCF